MLVKGFRYTYNRSSAFEVSTLSPPHDGKGIAYSKLEKKKHGTKWLEDFVARLHKVKRWYSS